MSIKKTIREMFPKIVDIRNRIYNDLAHRRFRNLPLKDVFSKIYTENHWKSKKSISGTGSDLEQTREVRTILEQIVAEYSITSILDIPCGDFNWIRLVKFPIGLQYFGADIVDELVEANIKKHEMPGRVFQYADITSSRLPNVDLVFCRDCLVHLSYEAIGQAIANLKRSGSKYLLTTTFPNYTNRDIVSGNWRPINLAAKPFTFPQPIHIFNEQCTEDERYADKSLALWRIQEL